MSLTCINCQKELIECRCPDAVARLKWLLSSDSPILIGSENARRLKRHMRELQGERELRAIRA